MIPYSVNRGSLFGFRLQLLKTVLAVPVLLSVSADTGCFLKYDLFVSHRSHWRKHFRAFRKTPQTIKKVFQSILGPIF